MAAERESVSFAEFHNYTLEDIDNNCEARVHRLHKIEEQYEGRRQELFLLEREIKQFEAMDGDFKFELEDLATGHDPEYSRLEEELRNAEKENTLLSASHRRRSNVYRQNYANIKNDIASVEVEIKLLEGKLAETLTSGDEQVLIENNKKALVFILEEIENAREQIIAATHANKILEQEIQETEEELECLQDKEKYANEKFQDSKKTMKELQSEVTEIQADIANKKTPSLGEASRGNSLFAEVYDRSVQLEAKLEFIKSHYTYMQSEHADIVTKMKAYSAENDKLTEEIRSEVEFGEKIHDGKVANYLTQITDGNARYMEKKKLFDTEIKMQIRDYPDAHVRYMHKEYNTAEAKMLNILNEMVTCREDSIGLSKQLEEVRNRVREKQLDNTKQSRELNILKVQQQTLCKEKNINPECKCKKKVTVQSKAHLFTFPKRSSSEDSVSVLSLSDSKSDDKVSSSDSAKAHSFSISESSSGASYRETIFTKC